jgi:hypothetical protein
VCIYKSINLCLCCCCCCCCSSNSSSLALLGFVLFCGIWVGFGSVQVCGVLSKSFFCCCCYKGVFIISTCAQVYLLSVFLSVFSVAFSCSVIHGVLVVASEFCFFGLHDVAAAKIIHPVCCCRIVGSVSP